MDTNKLHEILLKKLNIKWEEISTDLSNRIYEVAEELEQEIEDTINNSFEVLKDELESDGEYQDILQKKKNE